MRKRGFTLIELMIVVAIIALIAAFAIPALLRARLTANESGAIAGLRSLVANQAQFQGVAVVDQNNNGTGEYGVYSELAGAVLPRQDTNGNQPARRSAGEFCSAIFGVIDANGNASKSGYLYHMFLPGVGINDWGWAELNGGSTLSDQANGAQCATGTTGADITAQENYYSCYAWPVSRGRSGNRTFCVNVDGTIYQTSNDASAVTVYGGATGGPVAGAAFIQDPNDPAGREYKYPDANDATPNIGSDGNRWIPSSS